MNPYDTYEQRSCCGCFPMKSLTVGLGVVPCSVLVSDCVEISLPKKEKRNELCGTSATKKLLPR